MSGSRARVKPGRASLIGGIAVALAGFVLWCAITSELGFSGPLPLLLGAALALGAGMWIRMADL